MLIMYRDDPVIALCSSCDTFMGGTVNELSTLVLFKLAIKAVPGLQERQGSISLIAALPGYRPACPTPSWAIHQSTLGREGLPDNSVHDSSEKRLYRFFSCLYLIYSYPF